MPATPRERVVLVTGAAKRLGREIALALARDGWNVAVHYRDSVEEAHRTSAECAELSGNSMSFRTNLANETAVKNLLPSVIAHFGHVDAVVNSASTFEHDSTETFGFAAMEKHMRSNAGAAILLAQALHTHILHRRSDRAGGEIAEPRAQGVVINLLDQKLWNQNPDFISYTLSKAALEAATTMLALALAPAVRVVGVAPGLTLTSDLITDEQFKERHKLALLDQSSTPADVAATVRFALENRSITGTSLLVDGGQHLMRFTRDFSLM
jgi:NAD(P)-dependent dehydrogenase (short-subunit alcohol dehydrogenase family)